MRLSVAVVITAVTALLAACETMQAPAVKAAGARLESRSGSSVTGRVDFTESGGQVRAHVELAGLPPNSEHGFHIHEKGDCTAADASTAGGHFNPNGTQHGRAGVDPHHAGDMPSVTADAQGHVRADVVIDGVTLAEGPTSIAGRSVIVHRDRDDYTSQPAGNAGPRIACGIIALR